MATAVAITITLDSNQAKAALADLNAGIEQIGIKGEIAGVKAGGGLQKMGGHAATSLDSVRLLSQEFGLRLPRAIEAMLSRMPAVTSALSGIVGGLAAIAAVEVFARLAEEAKKFYDQMFDVNKAMREFAGTAGMAANQKLFNDASLETSIVLLKEANNQVKQLTARQQAAGADKPGGGFTQYVKAALAGSAGVGYMGGNSTQPSSPIFNTNDDVKLAEAHKNSADAQARDNQLRRQYALEDLQNTLAAHEARLKDGALIQAQLKDEQAISALKKKQAAESEQDLVNTTSAMQKLQVAMHVDYRDPKFVQIHSIDPDAGTEEKRLADKKAQMDADSKSFVLGQQQEEQRKKDAQEAAIAIMKANDQVVQAGLEGEELWKRQRLDGTNELTAQLQNQKATTEQIAAEVAAFQAKFDDQHLQALQQQTQEAQKALRTAQLSGLNPRDRAQKEFENRLDDINSDRSLAGSQQGIDAAGTMRLAAKTELDQKIHQLDEQEDQKNQQRMLANNAQDLQYAQEAARAEQRVKEDGIFGWVAAYKNGVAEVEAQEQQRLAKLAEDAVKEKLTKEEIQQRNVDIVRTANAQIAQQNEQLQHTIAGQLQSAFTDPVQYIKSAMEKMFFEILAAWLMRLNVFKGVFGSTMGGLQPGGAGGSGGTGGIMGNILRGTTGAFGGSPQLALGGGGSHAVGGVAGYGSGGSGGGGIGSDISTGLGIARQASGIPGIGGLLGLGGSSSSATPSIAAMTAGDPYDSAEGTDSGLTSMIPDQAMPDAPNIPGLGGGVQLPGGGMSAVAGGLGAAAGAFELGSSAYSAFETGGFKGTLNGILGGAAGGAAIGSIIPGVGTLIGAGIGAAVGGIAGILGTLFGEGPKHQARDYYNKNIYPTLEQAATNSNYGDFQTAIANVNSTAAQGLAYMTQKWGKDAGNWVNDNYMKKEVLKVDAMISNSAEGGRQFTQMSASQFHSGGTIGGFGSFATSSTEGFIHAMMGETVMNPAASSTHAAALSAMNSGAGAADIAGAYLAKSGSMGSGSSSGGDTHYHIHTLDTKTMEGWLKTGGAKLITRHQNNYAGAYAGDGIG